MNAPGLRRAGAGDLDALLARYAQLGPDDPPPVRERLAAILERIVASEDLAIRACTVSTKAAAFRRPTRPAWWRGPRKAESGVPAGM